MTRQDGFDTLDDESARHNTAPSGSPEPKGPAVSVVPPSPKSIGYARVSTGQQDLEVQREALLRAGCFQIVEEKVSGGKRDRDGLKMALRLLDPGDSLIVTKLDRLSRSMLDLLGIVEALKERGCFFVALDQQFDTSTPMGMLHLQILGAFAEWERAMIRSRVMPGLARAHSLGHFGGRRRALTGAKLERAKSMVAERPISPNTGKPMTMQEIADLLKVSRKTINRYCTRDGSPWGEALTAFRARNPDIREWLDRTDDVKRGTNPNNRRAS
jgi:DNA invertase Pin-like site-specific DNA recombinase